MGDSTKCFASCGVNKRPFRRRGTSAPRGNFGCSRQPALRKSKTRVLEVAKPCLIEPLRMKFATSLVLALLSCNSISARRHSSTSFEDYYQQFLSSPPLRLNDASYNSLTATPRNHSVVILLTALEARFGCQLCKDFQPEWEILGKSWAKGDKNGESRLLLGTVDFNDGRATFQKVWSIAT